MPKHHIFAMSFAKVYPLYVQKAEGKNGTKTEVDQIICWLTGYDKRDYGSKSKRRSTFKPSLIKRPSFIRIVRLSKA